MKIVIASGGFDPLHLGHIRYLEEAKSLGDKLFVILNNDIWLKNKKGYAFMDQSQRFEIIKSLKFVDVCILSRHEEDTDLSINVDIAYIIYLIGDINDKEKFEFILANGGDRKKDNIPELKLCEKLGIEMVFDVGGNKIESSSRLLRRINNEYIIK